MLHPRRLLLAYAAVACLGACGGDDSLPGDSGGPADAGADGDAMLGPLPSGAMLREPALPAAPAPVAWQCPEGWLRGDALTDDGAEVCLPWAEGGALICPPGEHQLPGSDACMPLGAVCGTDRFPPGAPAPTIFVDAAAAPGGGGSEASPFATLAEALTDAAAGDVVGVASGIYASAPLTVPADVTVRGACAASTVLDIDDRGAPALRLERGSGALDLSVRAQGTGIEVVGVGARLTAVEVREARGGGVVVRSDASLTADNLVVRFPEDDASRGLGLQVGARATVELTGLVIEHAMQFAISIAGTGASVTAEDVVIRNTTPLPSGTFGVAIQVDGAPLVMRRAVLEGNPVGIWIKGAAPRVELEDLVMVDAVPNSSGIGPGILFDGGELTVRSALFERMIMVAIQVQGAGVVSLSDVVCRDTLPIPEGYPNELLLGTPLSANHIASDGGTLSLEVHRASLEASRNAAMIFSGDGMQAQLEDLTVLDTASSPGDTISGDGIVLTAGAQVTLRRARFRRTEQVALRTADEGTALELYDVAVSDMLGRAFDGNVGWGTSFADGSTVNGERLSFEGAQEAAVLVSTDAVAILSDVTVDDVRTAPTSTFEGFGMGLWAATGGQLTVNRGHVSRARGLGVICTGDTVCRFTDLLVEATQSWERDTLLPIALGHGIELQYGRMELLRAVVSGNRSVGITTVGGALTVEDVIVRRTLEDEFEGGAGQGMTAAVGGSITGAYVEIDTNRHVGLGAFGAGSSVQLTDVRVLSTDRALCADAACSMNPGGVGVLAASAGTVSLERFEVATSALAGLMIATDGQMDLRQGVVRGNPIGASVQTAGYDLGRIQDDVQFVDNEANLDAASLPVPEPGPRLDVPPAEEP